MRHYLFGFYSSHSEIGITWEKIQPECQAQHLDSIVLEKI